MRDEKVLILDGNQRSALAVTRSLGREGIPLVIADEVDRTLSGASRYCRECFVYPSPGLDQDGFIQVVKEEALKRSVTAIFPMTEMSTYLILKHRGAFEGVSIPFAPFEDFDRLTDKWKLFELAIRLGVPVPRTWFIKRAADISGIVGELTFPVVLKPYRSRILTAAGWVSTSVKYANNFRELEEAVSGNVCFNEHPFMLQEYIKGTGQGIFALYDRGEAVAFFAHRRLREKPPSGGVSVYSESVRIDPDMLSSAKKILDHVKWQGIAMVEFKVSPDGKPYLMEINARFWGSLQLAVDAGVNFPYLLFKLAKGIPVGRLKDYQTGVKCRWLLGDLDNLYLSIFKGGNSISRRRTIKDFFGSFISGTRYEINRWEDMKPFLFELTQYIGVRSR